MSYTTVYVARADGNIHEYGDAQNAWNSAMLIWKVLAEKYRSLIEPRMRLPDGAAITLIEDQMALERLWHALPAFDEADRWVLGYTFDKAIVNREWAPTLLEHLADFNRRHTSVTNTIGKVVDLMTEALKDPDVRAICWQQTSVTDNLWWISGNDDDDEGRPVNIDRDDPEHFFWLTPEELARAA